MLTVHQTEKVAIAQKLLTEVKAEVAQEDIYKAMLLGVGANACDQVIQDDLPKSYVLPPTETWNKSNPSTGEIILKILGRIAGASLLASSICACISIGAFGLSEVKAASGWVDGNNYAAECRGYRGLTFAFLSVTLMCGVLGSVVGEVDNRIQRDE